MATGPRWKAFAGFASAYSAEAFALMHRFDPGPAMIASGSLGVCAEPATGGWRNKHSGIAKPSLIARPRRCRIGDLSASSTVSGGRPQPGPRGWREAGRSIDDRRRLRGRSWAGQRRIRCHLRHGSTRAPGGARRVAHPRDGCALASGPSSRLQFHTPNQRTHQKVRTRQPLDREPCRSEHAEQAATSVV